MAIKNFNDYSKLKKRYPYAFIEYDGDELYEDDYNDEAIDMPANNESIFEKYKKDLEDKSNKK